MGPPPPPHLTAQVSLWGCLGVPTGQGHGGASPESLGRPQ